MTTKYRNRKTVVDGITFDSKAEAMRYAALRIEEKAGLITDLKLQVPFVLTPSVILDGKKQRPVKYVADFTYTRDGKFIAEDCKGMKTAHYKDKRKQMRHIHNIEVLETCCWSLILN